MSSLADRLEGDMTSVTFHYIPNRPLSILSMVVYFVFILYLSYKVYKTHSRRFLYILPFTALMETVGYLIRILCYGYTTIPKYALMQLMLLLAPNALALVNYKTVGEIIRLSNIEKKPFFLKHKFVTWFFFSSDIFSFIMQGSGSGMQSAGGSKAETGKTIVLIGLSVQLVFLACFAVITAYVSRSDRYVFYVEGQQSPKSKLVICMGSTLILIYIRSIYRVAEYATGYDGPVARREWAFYVFDTLAIAICFVIYIVYFIGHYLPKHDAVQAPELSPSVNSKVMTQTEYYQNV